MNQYVTGAVIKELREKSGLIQAMLAKSFVYRIKRFRSGKRQKAIPILHCLSRLQMFLEYPLRN